MLDLRRMVDVGEGRPKLRAPQHRQRGRLWEIHGPLLCRKSRFAERLGRVLVASFLDQAWLPAWAAGVPL